MSNPGPLIIQSDHTMLLEVEHPQYTACRDFLGGFAELVKSPEFIHTYRVTPLSLWNAAALEIPLAEITEGLRRYAKYSLPDTVLFNMREWYHVYGKLVLEPYSKEKLKLRVEDEYIFEYLQHDERLESFWSENGCVLGEGSLLVPRGARGRVKQALVKAGYPVKDVCGYAPGAPFEISLREVDLDGHPFQLRDYQQDAVEAFYQAGRPTGGSGVIVLPCGSGKTIIGIGAMGRVSMHTLIIATNNVAVHQWRGELISKSHIHPGDIGEYTGLQKEIKPVTVTTYQMLTHRQSREDDFEHLELFTDHDWGLIIYDEVHMLPAPVFRATTEIQAKRRLGLTATLIREDGKEDDVFALIGPKRYDVPWKTLENRGYIAEAYCTEYRIPLPREVEVEYAHADKRARFRVAAENFAKIELVEQLIANHPDDRILVIGFYIDQLESIAEALDLSLITGKTKHEERQELYAAFRQKKIRVLVLSKVANFAVDLPDASVMIQVSGTFGSRQEEAQRLGRILRPKKRRSHFYTLVSKGTREQDFSMKRQLFLVEQGYRYRIRYF